MATIQVRVDDVLKERADRLFASLGMDTSTAVRVFLNASIENDGIPFTVRHKSIPESLVEAVDDSRNMKNLYGPFASAKDAVASMLEE